MDESQIKTLLAWKFFEGQSWPIAPGAFAALIDLGVGAREIADHFGVTQSDVAALRQKYGLSDESQQTK